MHMRFISTRGDKEALTGAQAIIRGIAPDRGLYVPERIPEMPFDLKDMVGKGYREVAAPVLKAFFDDLTDDEIESCVSGAYDEKFDIPEIAALVKAGDADFLELYHGKTAAFKDMALSILPRLLTVSAKKEHENDRICILTATSGDTGKAALEGFAGVPGTEIVVFYPNKGVSEVQERQMVTQEGGNTHVFAVNGNFDDAQTGVKNAFQDQAFRDALKERGVKLSSANSINVGRLVPQVVYYIYSYIKMAERGEIETGDKINIVVPTGNFGNILAAYYAFRMGLPVNRFICASNKNKILTDFIRTGVYDTRRDFYLTNSPSMDILISSNLERLLFHLSGGDSAMIAGLMGSLEKDKKYEVNCEIKSGLGMFYGGYCDIDDTNETIGKMYRENGYLIDTHTAVAYKVYEDYREETGDLTPTVIASTASPYKFAESVAGSIGLGKCEDGFSYIREVERETGVKVPDGLKDLDKKEISHSGVIGNDAEEMEKTIIGAVCGEAADDR